MKDLISLGERSIIETLLVPRYGNQDDFGDDCCVIRLNKTKCLVATIDPCPKPMSWILGYNDYYYFGWLLATINLSDIAAMGAQPLGLLTSYIMENETSVENFKRLLDGMDAACNQAGTKVLGGNLKEAKFFSCEASAFGIGNPNKLIRRKGAKVGDAIVVIGDLGFFWSGVLYSKNKLQLSKIESDKILMNVLTPRAKIKEGIIISKERLLSSGMDNSDGLFPSFKELATQNSVDFMIDFSHVNWDPTVLKISKKLNVDPIRLGLGWGDWQLVGTVPTEKLIKLTETMATLGTTVNIVGKVESGTGSVHLSHLGRKGIMTPFDSERFSHNSWFTIGIDSYIKDLLEKSLFV